LADLESLCADDPPGRPHWAIGVHAW